MWFLHDTAPVCCRVLWRLRISPRRSASRNSTDQNVVFAWRCMAQRHWSAKRNAAGESLRAGPRRAILRGSTSFLHGAARLVCRAHWRLRISLRRSASRNSARQDVASAWRSAMGLQGTFVLENLSAQVRVSKFCAAEYRFCMPQRHRSAGHIGV